MSLLETLTSSEIVDLSLELAQDLPCVWPGHMPFTHQIGNWFEHRPDADPPLSGRLGSYQTRWMTIDEHTGTHLDAPTHGVAPPDSGLPSAGVHGDVSVREVPLDQVRGEAVVVDATGMGGSADAPAPVVSAELLTAFERAHGRFGPKTVPLMRTGWDVHYRADDAGRRYVRDPLAGAAPGWPALTEAAMQLLVERGVRCVGTDAPSIGTAGNGGPVHDIGFAHGLVFVEGLANLAALPVRGSYFMAMPLKLRGGTGSPVRAIAVVAGQAAR
ncbi:cyclase family protein [Dactylosporangium sp. CA-233914]|uniref:cyclase family protein n=1 Tax=Dactylosporangium sp. CA-233914 TaxID=3239934 RepID=UPI003D8DED53